MEDKIVKILQALRVIQPDKKFKDRSRSQILNSQTHRRLTEVRVGIFESMKLGTAMALASILLFILVGGFSYFKLNNVASVVSASFDFENMNAEAEKIDLQIQLGEAEYFDDSARQMAAVLDDVSEVGTDEEIDKLLEEITL